MADWCSGRNTRMNASRAKAQLPSFDVQPLHFNANPLRKQKSIGAHALSSLVKQRSEAAGCCVVCQTTRSDSLAGCTLAPGAEARGGGRGRGGGGAGRPKNVAAAGMKRVSSGWCHLARAIEDVVPNPIIRPASLLRWWFEFAPELQVKRPLEKAVAGPEFLKNEELKQLAGNSQQVCSVEFHYLFDGLPSKAPLPDMAYAI